MKSIDTKADYKRALKAVRGLQRHVDKEVNQAARVVTDYLSGLPVKVEDFVETLSEGFEFKRLHLEVRMLAIDRTVYQLKKPLKVTVEREGNYYFAAARSFRVHGTGQDISKAMMNYMSELVSHYRWLKSHEGELVPSLVQELRKLEHLLS